MKKKRKIIIGAILILAVLILLLLAFVYFRGFQHTSTERLENRYSKTIESFVSSTDYDSDGVDDQTDMLQGTLNYISTAPEYKSKYYNTGYPDDNYGVCTDLVANACLEAGYDLMVLVQEDIQKNPKDYDIEGPDSNIDFRRVSNLKVYFSHTAVSLTTDIYDIEEWQGGDIVIFEKHIGIISDRRNEDGVTYVIHHNDPYQKSYEEDILETRDDIIGHYRISE